MTVWRYQPSVLEGLERLGIRPRGDSDPGVVRALVNDLYVFELRRLKLDLVARERSEGRRLRHQYSGLVRQLRERYSVLGLPADRWAER
jgi:hypothetical protein